MFNVFSPLSRRVALRYGLFAVTTAWVSTQLSSCTTSFNSESSHLSTLQFGILSTEDEDNQQGFWQEFLAELSAAIGVSVQPFFAQQYDDLILGMRSQDIHLAWLGGNAYIEAAQTSGAEAFALTLAADGSQGYQAHLITHIDQPFVQEAQVMGGDRYLLENAADLTFAFNDPTSTSGFLVPSYYIFAKNNVQPQRIFKSMSFLGTHEATALAVAAKTVDIATSNNEALDRLKRSHAEAHQNIAVLWTSPLIPNDPIAYHRDLPADLKAKIQTFFWNYDNTEQLKKMEWSGFASATDQVWHPIRELSLGQQILEIEANENIAPAEKDTMVTELKSQIERLSSSPSN